MYVCWQAGDDSNADWRVWNPQSCHWTTGLGWFGAVDSNHDPESQSLVSCQLDEHRSVGTANGAGSGARIRNLDVGNVVLFLLSYARVVRPEGIEPSSPG